MIKNAINAARTALWNGTIYNYSRKEYIRPGMVFDWQKDYAYYKSYDIRYLSEDIATLGDTALYLDADGLPTTGNVFLRDNRIGYNANNTTNVTISTPTPEALWKAGTPVLFGTVLPTDFAEPIAIYSGLDEKELVIRPRVDIYNMAIDYYRYMTGGMGTTTYNPFNSRAFCSIDDGYFTGMHGPEGTPIVLRYRKNITLLVNDADIDDIPDAARDVIPTIAAASIYIDRGEEVRGQNLNDAIGVGRALAFYKSQRSKLQETQFGKKIYYGDKANGVGDNYLFNVPR